MTFWVVFWKLVFVATLTLFAGMAVWVTIGGWIDIKEMFKKLGGDEDKPE